MKLVVFKILVYLRSKPLQQKIHYILYILYLYYAYYIFTWHERLSRRKLSSLYFSKKWLMNALFSNHQMLLRTLFAIWFFLNSTTGFIGITGMLNPQTVNIKQTSHFFETFKWLKKWLILLNALFTEDYVISILTDPVFF